MKSKALKQIEKDSENLAPGFNLGSSRQLTKAEAEALDSKAGLQMISLRLPLKTVEKLKFLAEKEGIKYQPYIRKHLMKLATEDVAATLTETRVQELIDQRFAKWTRGRGLKTG